jgi:HEAT repeat protein
MRLLPGKIGASAAWLLVALFLLSPIEMRAQPIFASPESLALRLADAVRAKDTSLITRFTGELVQIGEPAVPLMTAFLSDDNPKLVDYSAYTLVQIGTPVAVAAVLSALEGADNLSRRDNLRAALDTLQNRECSPVLLDAIQRKHSDDVYAASISALARISDEQIIGSLEGILRQSSDTWVLRRALRVFDQIREPRLVGFLAAELYEDNPSQIRAALPVALGRIGTPDAVRHLLDAFVRLQPDLRPYVEKGISRVANPDTLPLLLETLATESDDNLRSVVALALANYHSREALQRLDNLIDREVSPKVRGALIHSRDVVTLNVRETDR